MGFKLFLLFATDDEVKHVLIMDEVDGMSGNEDRAGVSGSASSCSLNTPAV